MSSQRNDKIIDARRRVVSCQDDDFVGPIVFLGAPVARMLAHLIQWTKNSIDKTLRTFFSLGKSST